MTNWNAKNVARKLFCLYSILSHILNLAECFTTDFIDFDTVSDSVSIFFYKTMQININDVNLSDEFCTFDIQTSQNLSSCLL